MNRVRRLAFAASVSATALLFPPWANAADATSGALTLDAGVPLEIACNTKAVVVAVDAAKATSGAIRLSLGLDQPGDDAKISAEARPAPSAPTAGTWRIVSVAGEHKGAFAVTQADTCRDGCPLAVQASGEIQLWAPKPSSIDQMGDTDVLLLAIIKPVTGVLRASTFRGKAIEALEEGTCVSHEDHAPGAAAGPAAPDQ